MWFEIYRDKSPSREWRWQLKSRNGKIIAVPGEGFVTKNACLHNIQLVKQSTNAPVYDVDGTQLDTDGELPPTTAADKLLQQVIKDDVFSE